MTYKYIFFNVIILMSNSLNEKEKIERFRESIRLLSYRRRGAEFGEPQSEVDPMRDAARSYDGKPSPLELALKKMEEEEPYL
jgi:hypothetical protein